jgi:hypothetical protein
MGKRFLITVLLFLPLWGWSQQKPVTPTGGLAFGGFVHSFGFGFDVRYIVPRTDKDFFFSLSMSSYKNPKELKIKSAYSDQGGKNYVFDKQNFCYVIAPTVGISRRLIARNLFNRVGISATISAGPLLALLKPYYVEVAVPFNGNQALVEAHPYDPLLYNYSNIYGSADYFLGMNAMKLTPGARAKLGTQVDLSAGTAYIRAVELSLFADIYSKKLPLLGESPNKQLFVGGSVEILVGNIW